MSRDISPEFLAAVTADEVHLALFYEGDFLDGSLRFWTGIEAIEWNGFTWEAAGSLLSVTVMPETSQVVGSGMAVTLAGVDPAMVALALSQSSQGLKGRIWIAVLDPETQAIIDAPYQAFAGRLDVPMIEDSEQAVTITISYENLLAGLTEVVERRYTHEDQQIEHPDDLAFEFVTSMQNYVIQW